MGPLTVNPLSWQAPAPSGAPTWASSTDRPSDTNDLRLTTAEAHLSEGDIQSGCAFYLHLEVIGKDRDPLEELLHEDPALVIAGVVLRGPRLLSHSLCEL